MAFFNYETMTSLGAFILNEFLDKIENVLAVV